MASSPMNEVIQHLRRAVFLRDSDGLTDEQLLECYWSRHDEAALAALVQRHARMVWGVCCRVLGHYHDAEDAFQATFLLLVRKAASIRTPNLLANWLYGAAYQTALNAKTAAGKRRTRERQVTEMPEPEIVHRDIWHELKPLLDQELNRLPDKYRIPILLCDLEGKTRKEAARLLGWPEGTVAGRLARARVMLAKRLARHGVVESGGILAAMLIQNVASAGVPSIVVSSTITAATLFAAGQTVAWGLISAKAVALSEGVMKTMALSKLRIWGVLLVILAIGMGAGTVAAWMLGQDAAGIRGKDVKPEPQSTKSAPTDLHGDSLPAGALARMGTMRLRHKGGGQTVAFSPDGRTMFTGGDDGMIRLWDLATGKLLKTLQQKPHMSEPDALNAVAVCPKGKVIAAAWDGGLQLWDVAGGKNLYLLEQGPVFSLAFTPDGKNLACGSGRDGDIRIWDVATGKEVRRFSWHRYGVTNLAYMADGRKLVSASSTQTGGLHVHVGDAVTGKEIDGFNRDDYPPLALSADGKALAAGGVGNATVLLLDAMTGKELIRFSEHLHGVNGLAFVPDGKTVASVGPDETIRWWDRTSGKEIRKATWGKVPTIPMNSRSRLAFTPDGKTLVSSYGDCLIRLWDVATGKQRQGPEGHEGGVFMVAVSPDGKSLASCSMDDRTVRTWEVASGRPLKMFRHPASVRCVLFSSDGKQVISGSADDAIRVWDTAAGKGIQTMRLSDPGQGEEPQQILALGQTGGGKKLLSLSMGLSGNFAGVVSTWDVITGRRLNKDKAADDAFSNFSADGTLLSGLKGGRISVQEVGTGKQVLNLAVPPDADKFWYPVVLSPSGKLLATVTTKRGGAGPNRNLMHTIRVFELASGKELWKAPTPCWGRVMAFSPDSTKLAWAGDNILAVHDAANGKELLQRQGFCATVLSLAFAPDNATLATGLGDGSVLVWELAGAVRKEEKTKKTAGL